MNQTPRVTAKDIANKCGISQATVSYVINNKEGKNISEKTRKLILETAKSLNYFPNNAARNMRTSKSMSIGVVTGQNSINIGFNHILRGIKSSLDSKGYTLTLLNDGNGHQVDENSEASQEYIMHYRSNRIDGIVFIFYDMTTQILDSLNEYSIPFMVVGENGVWSKNLDRKKDFEQVIDECGRFCKEKSFERIRFFSIRYNQTVYSTKYNLFKEAIDRHYPQANLERVVIQVQDRANKDLVEDISAYMENHNFDIAITPNQRLGFLTQSCIMKREFVIPQRIKHICLNSSHIFSLVYPTITAIDIPLTSMGEFAAQQLLNIIYGREVEEKDFHCRLKHAMSTMS